MARHPAVRRAVKTVADPAAVGRAAVAGLVGLGGWLGYQLFLQHGRILLRLEALEREVAGLAGTPAGDDGPAAGLPGGSVVLDFELPDLAGRRVTLSQWRGRRVLLIFFDPGCGFCRRMLPDLAALPPAPAEGRPVPVLVSTGDAAENRRLVEQHGVRCPVLLQEDREVAALYRVGATPMGYLIDEHGATVGPPAVGAPALLALAGAPAAPAGAAAPAGFGLTPSPAGRRLERNGLTAGTPAPAFRLPRLDGGELSLEAYRGRRVLLVFSDPACRPCHQLAPALEEVHRRSPDLRVLMISRGSPEANRQVVAEHGLSFPVALQRHWEVSRDYGMFATPIGYLIDEQGTIAADVAVGAEQILALSLASARPAAPGGGGGCPR